MTPPAPVLDETPVLLMTRAEGTWLVLLPLNRLLASTPLSREAVGGIALAIGPDRRVAEAGVGAGAAGEFRIDAGRRIARPVKLPVASGTASICVRVHHVAVGGIDGVHQRSGFHFDGLAGLAHLELRIHRGGAIGLHRDVLRLLRHRSHRPYRSACRCRWAGSRTSRCLRRWSSAVRVSEVCSSSNRDRGIGNDAAGRVGNVAGDAAKRLLCKQRRTAQRNDCRERQQPGKQREDSRMEYLKGTWPRNREFPLRLFESSKSTWLVQSF